MIYDCIAPDQPLWDIGCDHGYLGLQAHREGLCSQVHLVDRSLPVVDRLRSQVAQSWPDGPGEGLRICHCDAAQESLPVTAGTVIIAGVGMWTILRILSRTFGRQIPAKVRLVVASTMEEELLRLHLHRLGWRLQHEALYCESGNVRQLLVWGPTGESALPFWNDSALSRGNGLLEEFLSQRRRYYSVNRSSDPDLVYLRQALAACEAAAFAPTSGHSDRRDVTHGSREDTDDGTDRIRR